MATRWERPGGTAMSIGSVLSRAFAAVGAAPLTFFGLSFVLGALPYAIAMTSMRGLQRPAFPGAVGAPVLTVGGNPAVTAWPTVLAAGLIWWLFYLTCKAVLIRTTVAELDREPATIGGHLAAAARLLLPLIGLSLLTSIALMIGFVLLIVPGVILYLVWAVTTPVLVAEREGVFAAFGRSARLTKGARWRILGLSLVVWVIYFIAAAAFGIVGVLARTIAPTAPELVQTISSVILQTGFIAVWTAIQATLYVELRDEKDGPAGERLADIFA